MRYLAKCAEKMAMLEALAAELGCSVHELMAEVVYAFFSTAGLPDELIDEIDFNDDQNLLEFFLDWCFNSEVLYFTFLQKYDIIYIYKQEKIVLSEEIFSKRFPSYIYYKTENLWIVKLKYGVR